MPPRRPPIESAPPTVSTAEPVRRNAGRSRRAILDAAERLFAERGFDSTSLQDIGATAGVSRGTPGYFFGSKEALYRAVLDRAIAARRELVAALAEQAARTNRPPADTVAEFVGSFLEVLAADPNFLPLVERENLAGRQLYVSEAQLEGLRRSVDRLAAEMRQGGFRHQDPSHLFISCLALCEWPFAHQPLLAGLGLDPRDPDFLAARKRHILELIRGGFGDDAERG